MRKESSFVLDERDEEAARLLAELGLGRSVARVLVYLSHVPEASSSRIEQATGLRQPEVSVSTGVLRRRGWAVKRDIRRAGKGRPGHAYSLVVSLAEVVVAIEERKRAEAETSFRNLERLRDILASGGSLDRRAVSSSRAEGSAGRALVESTTAT